MEIRTIRGVFIILRLGAQSNYIVKYFEGSNDNVQLDNNTPFLVAHYCPL